MDFIVAVKKVESFAMDTLSSDEDMLDIAHAGTTGGEERRGGGGAGGAGAGGGEEAGTEAGEKRALHLHTGLGGKFLML